MGNAQLFTGGHKRWKIYTIGKLFKNLPRYRTLLSLVTVLKTEVLTPGMFFLVPQFHIVSFQNSSLRRWTQQAACPESH